MAIEADVKDKNRVLQKLTDIEDALDYSTNRTISVIPEIKQMAVTLDAENAQIIKSYNHSRDWINKMIHRMWRIDDELFVKRRPSALL